MSSFVISSLYSLSKSSLLVPSLVFAKSVDNLYNYLLGAPYFTFEDSTRTNDRAAADHLVMFDIFRFPVDFKELEASVIIIHRKLVVREMLGRIVKNRRPIDCCESE